jgi:hypothetical protein
MRFALFNSAEAGGNGGQGYHNYTDYNIEADALGYYSSFLVEHLSAAGRRSRQPCSC